MSERRDSGKDFEGAPAAAPENSTKTETALLGPHGSQEAPTSASSSLELPESALPHHDCDCGHATTGQHPEWRAQLNLPHRPKAIEAAAERRPADADEPASPHAVPTAGGSQTSQQQHSAKVAAAPSSDASTATALPYDINVPSVQASASEMSRLLRPEYAPHWDATTYPAHPLHAYADPALHPGAAARLDEMLSAGGVVHVRHITPRLGSAVRGVRLLGLDAAGRAALALLVARRKVVVLAGQGDFVGAGPEAQIGFASAFGRLAVQPVSPMVRGYPPFQVNLRAGNRDEIAGFLDKTTTTTLWHHDVSFEKQPPAYVWLGMLQGPATGGDTVFVDTAKAYERLSPTMRGFLDTLWATHTSRKMIGHVTQSGGRARREPEDSVHPVVRVHPVTGQRCLFVNEEFVAGIVGLKKEENDALMQFLIRHMVTGHDFQARVSWEKDAVVMFDNRSTLHSAVVDYITDEGEAEPRHLFRLVAHGEVPIPVHAKEDDVERADAEPKSTEEKSA